MDVDVAAEGASRRQGIAPVAAPPAKAPSATRAAIAAQKLRSPSTSRATGAAIAARAAHVTGAGIARSAANGLAARERAAEDVDRPAILIQAATEGAAAVVSPDGTVLVFVAQQGDGPRRLYVRRFDRLQAVPLSGTDGARHPFFSPDGNWVIYTVQQWDPATKPKES